MENMQTVLQSLESRKRFLSVKPRTLKTPDGLDIVSGEIVTDIPSALKPVCPRCKTAIESMSHGWLNGGYVDGKTQIVPCPECSGPVRERMAAKRRAVLVDRLFGGVHIPQNALTWTFDTFPVHGDQRALTLVRTFVVQHLAGDSTSKRGFWLAGQTGLGKSSLAISALHSVVEAGHTGLFVLTADLFDRLRASYRRERKQEQQLSSRYSEIEIEDRPDDLLEAVNTVEWLVLDDLGVEMSTDDVIRKFYLIVQKRMQQGLYTIFTSNLSLHDLEESWRPKHIAPGGFHAGQRVIERIKEYCIGHQFKGDTLRK
ncbi:MAG: ATP-binding protein [Ktedonobacteraceae bacterium]